jgi:hypothetical protein
MTPDAEYDAPSVLIVSELDDPWAPATVFELLENARRVESFCAGWTSGATWRYGAPCA